MPDQGPTGASEFDGIAFPDEIQLVVEGLRQARQEWRAAHHHHVEHGGRFPSRQALKRIMRELGIALFPLRLGPPELTVANEDAYVAVTLETTLSQLGAQIGIERRHAAAGPVADLESSDALVGTIAANLPAIRRLLDSDVEAAYASDPAARSVDEVLVAYPSLTAIIHHRIAHLLHRLGLPLVARIISGLAHGETGIDIHPGARIGRSFFIDHGTGVVIGETAELGDRVRLYQGVTLGGDPALADRESSGPRHPIVEDDVVIHANATLLGRITIGARSHIGGGVWLREDVPADSVVEIARPLVRSCRVA